jgi:hypothetical protein
MEISLASCPGVSAYRSSTPPMMARVRAPSMILSSSHVEKTLLPLVAPQVSDYGSVLVLCCIQ